MRSWITAMPGETLCCVGCHERRIRRRRPQTIAARRTPSADRALVRPDARIQFPPRGPAGAGQVTASAATTASRGTDGRRSRTCAATRMPTSFFAAATRADSHPRHAREKLLGKYGGDLRTQLHDVANLVRVGGLESDLHLLPPMEFHAGTTRVDPDAAQRPSRRRAGRGGLGPAGRPGST